MVGINKELSEDWVMGVNDFTLKEGIILIPNSFDENGQPEYHQGDLKLTFNISDDPMKNYLKLRGFSRPPTGEFVTREFDLTGDDTYKIEKASEILYVARSLFDTVQEVVSTSSFKVSAQVANILTEYDDRFLANDRGGELICKIKSGGNTYVKAFSISGQTVSLRDIKDWESGATGSTFTIGTLAVGDSFSLINAYDVLPEGLEETSGYPTYGYVTKHVEASGSWIKFNKYDKPNKSITGKLLITYYPLSDFSPEYPYWDKMNRYGTYAVEENIDFPIISAQELELLNNFKKYLDSLITMTLVTKRPTVLKRGQEIVFSASRYPQGIFKVINNVVRTETETGGNNNKGNKIQTITFANYTDNWARIISRLKNRNDISKVKLAQNRKQQTDISLRLTVLWSPLERSTSAPSTPENLSVVDYGINYITITWDLIPEAINYNIKVYNTSDDSLVYDDYANDNDYSADPLTSGEYRFEVYAINGWGISDPGTITQATIEVPVSGNLRLFYQFNGNYNDDSGNSYTGTGAGSASTSGNYLTIPNSGTNYVSVPYQAGNGLNDFTIAFWEKIDTYNIVNHFFSTMKTNVPTDIGLYTSFTNSTNNLMIGFAGSNYSKTTSAPGSNALVHLAFTRSGTTLKFYLNGSQLGTNVSCVSTSIVVLLNGFLLAQRQETVGSPGAYSGQNLAGKLDNFMIWDTALTDAEILDVYNLPKDLI